MRIEKITNRILVDNNYKIESMELDFTYERVSFIHWLGYMLLGGVKTDYEIVTENQYETPKTKSQEEIDIVINGADKLQRYFIKR